MTTACITWTAVGAVAAGLGAIATAWMACQTHKSNKNAKEAILENKKGAFFDMVVSMYSNCRKTIEQMSIINEDCTTTSKPIGLDCLVYVYDKLFKTRLTTKIDRSKKPSEQKEESIVPEKKAVRETFEKIIHNRYPNIGTYLSSVVAIVGMIDDEKTFDNKFKDKCISYIKSQTTAGEKLWLYYYSLFDFDKSRLLNKYNILTGVPEDRLITMQ